MQRHPVEPPRRTADELPRRLTAPLRFGRRLSRLPPSVAAFQAGARLLAWWAGDDAPKGALRPDDLAVLLRLAQGRREVAELGTAKGWTAISLALADGRRRVASFDPIVQPMRERYLGLAPSARDRINFVALPGEAGAVGITAPVEFLFIDSSHARAATIRQFEAWKPALAEDSIVVFDDYGHPDYPGVAEAVRELALSGETSGLLFIHRRGGET